MSILMAIDYWRSRAQQAEAHAGMQESELRSLRERMNEAIEENIQVAFAARALGRAVQVGTVQLRSGQRSRRSLTCCTRRLRVR